MPFPFVLNFRIADGLNLSALASCLVVLASFRHVFLCWLKLAEENNLVTIVQCNQMHRSLLRDLFVYLLITLKHLLWIPLETWTRWFVGHFDCSIFYGSLLQGCYYPGRRKEMVKFQSSNTILCGSVHEIAVIWMESLQSTTSIFHFTLPVMRRNMLISPPYFCLLVQAFFFFSYCCNYQQTLAVVGRKMEEKNKTNRINCIYERNWLIQVNKISERFCF